MPANRNVTSDPQLTDAGICTNPILLRLPDVERMTGIKRSMIYRLEGEDRFPCRVKIGQHASAWVASEVGAWIAARISARDAAA